MMRKVAIGEGAQAEQDGCVEEARQGKKAKGNHERAAQAGAAGTGLFGALLWTWGFVV